MSDAGVPRWLRPALVGPFLVAVAGALSGWWAVHHLPNPDEGAVLTNAMKILDGGVFYREIDAYPYPASNYALAAAMSIFGESLGVARALAALLFCVVVGSLYVSAVQLLGARRAAVFGVSLLAFKFLGFPMFTSYFYGDFSFAFACLALPLVLAERDSGRRARLFFAGACLAISFFSKQNLGLYLAAAVALQLGLPSVFARRLRGRPARDLGAFGAGLGAVAVPVFAFFASHGVLGAMLASGFVRPFTGYFPVSGLPPGYMFEWWNFGAPDADNTAVLYFPLAPLYLLRTGSFPFESLYGLWWPLLEVFSRLVYTSLVVAFAIPLWRWLRSWRETPEAGDARVFVLAQLAFGFVLSAFPRADWGHVVGVYPVVWLLFFALVRPGRVGRRVEVGGVALGVTVSLVLTLALHGRMTYALDLERGRIWVEPGEAWVESVIHAIHDRVPPGEPLFVYGHEAHIYFLADRYNAWPFAQLYPGQTGPGGGEQVVAVLERNRPRVVYRGLGAWPGSQALDQDLPALHTYVRKKFRRIPRFFEKYPPAEGGPPHPMFLGMLKARGRVPPSGAEAPIR